MKKIILGIIAAVCMLLFVGCNADSRGATTVSLTGNENILPPELKGLKVYNVRVGNGNYIYVAVLDGKVNSTSNSRLIRTGTLNRIERRDVIMIEKKDEVGDILFENDTIVIIRKTLNK